MNSDEEGRDLIKDSDWLDGVGVKGVCLIWKVGGGSMTSESFHVLVLTPSTTFHSIRPPKFAPKANIMGPCSVL